MEANFTGIAMEDKDSEGGRVRCHAVFTVWLERGYPHDALSLDREAVSFTVHSLAADAEARLFAELDADLSPDGVACLRRTRGMELDVPASMCAGGSPHRWISDRTGMLLSRCGLKVGRLAAASARGVLAAALAEDAMDATRAVRGADPATTGGHALAAAAMSAAAACLRAEAAGGISPGLSGEAREACREIAAAAWSGEPDGGAAERLGPLSDAIRDTAAALA